MKAICVTGSVACGKTTFAKELACATGHEYVDVNEVIKNNPSVVEGYDPEMDTNDVDVEELVKILSEMIQKSKKVLIIDSHFSHFLPKKLVKICFVVKCDLKEVKKRLELRGYSEKKVKENVETEVFDVCFVESIEHGHKVAVVETTEGFEINDALGVLQ